MADQNQTNDPGDSSRIDPAVSVPGSLPEIKGVALKELANTLAGTTAEKYLEIAPESDSFAVGLYKLGSQLTSLPDDIKDYPALLGKLGEHLEFDSSHVQLIREKVVAAIIPYLNNPDSEIEMLAFRAIAKSTVQLPELVPVAISKIESPRSESEMDEYLAAQALRFLAAQDRLALNDRQLAVVAERLGIGQADTIRMLASEVLGNMGNSAVKFLPRMIEVWSDFIDKKDLMSQAIGHAIFRHIEKLCPDLYKPEAYMLDKKNNPFQKLGIELSESDWELIHAVIRLSARNN